jgi:hypothetical protein
MVIRTSERPTAADRHETRVAFFREDQPSASSARICLTSTTMSCPFRSTAGTGHAFILTDSPGPATSSQAMAVDEAADCPSTLGKWGTPVRAVPRF